ncbi:MAG: hypothetical protein RL701_3056 [Pseudomonadota bacterium]
MANTRRKKLESRLAARKQGSLAQALFQASRIYNEQAIAQLRDRLPEARIGHTRLLPYIDLQGTRQTELARRIGISKQAVGQWVDELIALKYLMRTPDPDDGRAWLVHFTDHGLEQLIAGFDTLDAIEEKVSAHLGVRTIKDLHRDLLQLISALTKT